MKKYLYCCVAAIAVASLAMSCGAAKEESAAADEWKEMDDFHLVMAEVYHPLKDSGNLAPIKTMAGELAASAEAWAKAEVPAKMDNDEVKGLIEKLQGGTSDLASRVTNGASDDEISAQLTELHEMFHHIQEKWYSSDGKEHEHH